MDVRGLASEDGRPILDGNHLGPLVLIFIPTFLCPAGLLVISTIIVRHRAGAAFSWTWSNPVMGDFLGLACMLILSTAWSAVVCTQTQVGLGTVTRPDNVASFEKVGVSRFYQAPLQLTRLRSKYEYAAELLYLLAIMFWKFTNGLCNANVFSLASSKKGLYATLLTVAITIGFLGAFFAAAFQCNGPHFWAIRDVAASQCFNRVRDPPDPGSCLLTGRV